MMRIQNLHFLTVLFRVYQWCLLWDSCESLLCPEVSSIHNASSFSLGNCSLDPDLEAYWSLGGEELSELSLAGPIRPSPSELDLSLIAKAFPRLTSLRITGIPSLLRITFKNDEARFPYLSSLNLSSNPSLHQVCPSIFQRSPQLSFANLSHTPLQHFPFINLQRTFRVDLNQTEISCDCHLNHLSWIKEGHLPDLTCLDHRSRRRQLSSLTCDSSRRLLTTLLKPEPSSVRSVWSTVRLDCRVKGADVIAWVVNSFNDEEERVYKTLVGHGIPQCHVEVHGHTCGLLTVSEHGIQMETLSEDERVRTLSNGSLIIKDFGWQDRGIYSCIATNLWNDTGIRHECLLNLDPVYRSILYYWSLMYGFISAAGFLLLTLIVKLVHFLLQNYGCCLCCCCCKDRLPPKAKKLKTAIDSIETYRDQQLERLRENYTQQSDWIRENCTVQMERVRDNYDSQVQNLKDIRQYGTCQLVAVRQQYFDQRCCWRISSWTTKLRTYRLSKQSRKLYQSRPMTGKRHNSCCCEYVPRRLFVRHGEEVLCPRMSSSPSSVSPSVSGSSHMEVLCESGAYYSGHVEEVYPSSSELRLPGAPPHATSHPGTHSFSIGEEVEVLNTARDLRPLAGGLHASRSSGATWPSFEAPGLQPSGPPGPPLPPIQHAAHPGQGL